MCCNKVNPHLRHRVPFLCASFYCLYHCVLYRSGMFKINEQSSQRNLKCSCKFWKWKLKKNSLENQSMLSTWWAVTIKLWHWKSHWKSRVTLKKMGTKNWVTLKIFQCDLKSFSVILLSLINEGKYFSEIILDYHCDFLCKYFSVWFLCLFSVTKIVSVIFSVILFFPFTICKLHFQNEYFKCHFRFHLLTNSRFELLETRPKYRSNV